MTVQVSNNRSAVVSKWRSVFHRTLSDSHNDDTLPRICSDYGEQRNIFPLKLEMHRVASISIIIAPASHAWK